MHFEIKLKIKDRDEMECEDATERDIGNWEARDTYTMRQREQDYYTTKSNQRFCVFHVKDDKKN